ncbi:MAG: LURP-one-related/scramblase family protein [Phycisphaerae bacterium]
MRYMLKQKMFSLGQDFTILDASGDRAFVVDGKAFSFGQKFSFQDAHGHELLFVRQRHFAWRPTYLIFREGKRIAVVTRKPFTFFRSIFFVNLVGAGRIVVEGAMWEHEYAFKRKRATIATVSRKWFSWADTYGVEISDDEDHPLLLAVAVILDLMCQAKAAASVG